MGTLFLFLLLLLLVLASCTQPQVYIVYFGHHKGDKLPHEIEDTHFSYLHSIKQSKEEAKASLIYSYKHSINGFAAVLTPDEAYKLSGLEEVVTVIQSHPQKHTMHTTRSWEFVGLEEMPGGPHLQYTKKGEDMLSLAKYGNDVIVGVLDSGFWPESKSFRDEGMRPIPTTWKGICQGGDAFNASHCNKKVIGARYYIKQYEQTYGPLNRSLEYLSPRDRDGHGTHTASTVAGRVVHGASFLGEFAVGTASGGAPLARLAIYKACWAIPGQEKVSGNTCFEADMLAAIDDAIADGVHVLSVSIGSTTPIRYDTDGIAIGALHAVKHNIVVACSAGNLGPTPGSLSNPAPWIITVGASSLDRNFPAPVVLGNGLKVEGETVTTYKLEKMHPLVYAAQVELPTVPKNLSGQCMPNSLSIEKATGKIVLCLRGNGTRIGKGVEVKRAGGAGYILGNSPANGAEIPADAHVLPATAVGSNEAIKILQYINSTKNPTATITPATTIINTKPAPSMASFTSRGPNLIDSYTLKPDITAPGLNILAAWSGADAPTKLSSDERRVEWNIYSGTSMSCPHVAGAAALVKAIHPDWSSAAIRSAIMTTAGQVNNVGTPITDEMGNEADPFQFGAGHFQPTKAIDPGLVYDASYNDYLLYLCSGGLTNLDPSFKCPQKLPKRNDLNYPSIAISGFNGTVTVRRSVTNVGSTKSLYLASVKPPVGYKVKVSPRALSFKQVGQKKRFRVTFEADKRVSISKVEQVKYAFGWLTWSDGLHTVRSPMVVSAP